MDKEEFIKFLKDKGKKHIIFDFDETLCTLLIDWSNWVTEMEQLFISYGLGLDPKETGYAPAQNYCIEKFGDEARDRIIGINLKNEKEFCSGYDLHPMTGQLLRTAREHAELYVWTSNDQETVLPIIEKLDFSKYFKKIVTRNDVRFIKPHPDGFRLIHDSQKPRSEYLLIGDSKADSGAAANAGIDFLYISEIRFVSDVQENLTV